jgi:ribosomal-protein-alanine acetyltransferase
MTWKLRTAAVGDLDRIMQLETGTFGTDAWSREAMRRDLVSRQCYYLVAERLGFPGELDGYAGLFAPSGALEGDIQTIAVAESARRRGLGRALMQALIGEARKRGANEVFLEVRADNPGAHDLYVTLGFEDIAVRVAYYQPDGVDAIVMRQVIPDPTTQLTTRPEAGE